MERLKNKVLASLAALALAGGATVAAVPAPTGNAATPACGATCVALYDQTLGSGDVSTVSGGTAQLGQHVILSPAGPYSDEDWHLLTIANAATLYADGIVGAAVGTTWPSDIGYEYEYAPDGVSTTFCLGTATTAGNGTAVTLQPCGLTSKTVWIALSIDDIGGYQPMINASDTVTSAPYVLTASNDGAKLTTRVAGDRSFIGDAGRTDGTELDGIAVQGSVDGQV
jgi:hypothetical protein